MSISSKLIWQMMQYLVDEFSLKKGQVLSKGLSGRVAGLAGPAAEVSGRGSSLESPRR